ncbi:hypothetical protein [Arthrobacter sp. VKM Ac-2550]|uniref:hypothetical protein n=1 Tax=Crystallibacter permensis TaxID=1938888 RepID=UPI002227F509|nr:hypothetical protein [Arthrobacter sp. VKM Ac-2550]MCW2131642.1 hypothetical protein [Arthrobacter sp. VKM Ac-2550]
MTIWDQTKAASAAHPGLDTADADALTLHLWRRLDFRFLLPVLEPGRVGYAGAVDAETVAALRLLDPDADFVPVDGSQTYENEFDVILLHSPDRRTFESAVAAMKPGGWMCAEVRSSLLRTSGSRTLLGWERTFVRAGLQDVGVHWHAPGLEFPSRIVPVASAMAVRDALSRHQQVRMGKAKELIGRTALALGLFAAAVPEGTVIGRRPCRGDLN